LFFRGNATFPDDFLGPQKRSEEQQREAATQFRDEFVKSFLRVFVLWTFWIFAGLWTFSLWRSGGIKELPWGIVSGFVLGIMASATLACLVLVLDLVPHMVWDLVVSGSSGALVPLWLLVALVCWTLIGAGLGLALAFLGPLGQVILAPVQQGLAGLCRLCGLAGLAETFAPA
jgi:hypothetical protein